MSWLSFFRKNKLEPKPDDSEFYSHAEDIPVTRRGRGKVQGDEPVDPVLPEKKRARRRLVGAVAITVTLAVVLPMVLDSEPKPVSGDITIQIPSRDKVPKLSASYPSAPAAVASVPDKAPEAPPAANNATDAQGKPPVAEAPAKPAPVKPVAEPAKAVKAETGNGNAKPAEKAAGKFVIQVAALASQDKAVELQSRLTKAGFKSHTQKVATKDGNRIRVRVGPYANKGEAEKACPKLNKMNLKCTVLSN